MYYTTTKSILPHLGRTDQSLNITEVVRERRSSWSRPQCQWCLYWIMICSLSDWPSSLLHFLGMVVTVMHVAHAFWACAVIIVWWCPGRDKPSNRMRWNSPLEIFGVWMKQGCYRSLMYKVELIHTKTRHKGLSSPELALEEKERRLIICYILTYLV